MKNEKKVQKQSHTVKPKLPPVTIENARIAFRNFAGKEGKYNAAGRRNFSILLAQEVAVELERQGWNVKWLEPREVGDEKQPIIRVDVRYSNIPPKIMVITSQNKSILDESTVHVLDWAEIENVDLILNPSAWDVNGKSGIKAYLKKMYVTLVEDELEAKYRDVPDAAIHNIEEDDN